MHTWLFFLFFAFHPSVEKVLTNHPIVDGHNDTPWTIREYYKSDLSQVPFDKDTSHLSHPMGTDIPRLRKGHVGTQIFSIYVPTNLSPSEAVKTALEQIDLVYRLVEKYPQDLVLATSPEDILKANQEGKIACLMGMEGGHMIGESLAVLRMFAYLGIRYLTLTHWQNTPWADAATDKPEHHGLTPFGEEVVRELNRLGVLVDLSHTSAETMEDVLRITTKPVIFSHSGAFGVNPHPRNVPDEILRKLKTNGGIVMVDFVPGFVSRKAWNYWAERKAQKSRLETLLLGNPEKINTQMKAWEEEHPPPIVTLEEVVDHIDYIRNIIGSSHLGIGSDFEGFSFSVQGLTSVADFPRLFDEMKKRGYTEKEMANIARENFLRVFREVEKGE